MIGQEHLSHHWGGRQEEEAGDKVLPLHWVPLAGCHLLGPPLLSAAPLESACLRLPGVPHPMFPGG